MTSSAIIHRSLPHVAQEVVIVPEGILPAGAEKEAVAATETAEEFEVAQITEEGLEAEEYVIVQASPEKVAPVSATAPVSHPILEEFTEEFDQEPAARRQPAPSAAAAAVTPAAAEAKPAPPPAAQLPEKGSAVGPVTAGHKLTSLTRNKCLPSQIRLSQQRVGKAET